MRVEGSNQSWSASQRMSQILVVLHQKNIIQQVGIGFYIYLITVGVCSFVCLCLCNTFLTVAHHSNSRLGLSLHQPALLPQGEVQVDKRLEEDGFLCSWTCVACHLIIIVIINNILQFPLSPRGAIVFFSSEMTLWFFTTVRVVKDIVSCVDFHNTIVDRFSIL